MHDHLRAQAHSLSVKNNHLHALRIAAIESLKWRGWPRNCWANQQSWSCAQKQSPSFLKDFHSTQTTVNSTKSPHGQVAFRQKVPMTNSCPTSVPICKIQLGDGATVSQPFGRIQTSCVWALLWLMFKCNRTFLLPNSTWRLASGEVSAGSMLVSPAAELALAQRKGFAKSLLKIVKNVEKCETCF